jgi:hypothetical protein
MLRSSRMKSEGCGAGVAGRWAAAGQVAPGMPAAGIWFALSSVAILNSLSIWFAYFVLFLRWDKYV